ncbi:hypothetical protein G3I40_29160 [Streptomyces sp. SID14478]|uniref:hypothetical protein n=1 Tax=Streptomyces sp. SID14478 TaxID=2706073 RepID=UPI0013D9D80A|nr:hypothetical protein [Streptomyces sp. SID14478]NEB79256.1 hypothetical protein [Streptomyces sp. SID14478]
MRPAFLRSAVVTAVLGGAVLVPTAAYADAQVHAPAARTVEVADSQDQPAAPSPDDPSANPYFLVAGGAMAAAGAAGLVYSTVRRGRADA